MKDPIKTISNMRIALIIIGTLVLLCNAHEAISLWHEYHADIGAGGVSEAHAEERHPSTLHCAPPDDLGFMTCRGGP